MSVSTVHVDYARGADIDAVSAVLVEAAEWMAAHKRALWSAASLGPDFVAPHLANRELLAARQNGEIVGVTLLLWQDLEFWPDHDDGRSGYMHKLAVTRRVAGHGVSKALVDGAARGEIKRPGPASTRLRSGALSAVRTARLHQTGSCDGPATRSRIVRRGALPEADYRRFS